MCPLLEIMVLWEYYCDSLYTIIVLLDYGDYSVIKVLLKSIPG